MIKCPTPFYSLKATSDFTSARIRLLADFALSFSEISASPLLTDAPTALEEPTAESESEPAPEPEPSHAPLLPSVPLDGEIQWQIYTQACHEDPARFCLIMAIASAESGYDPLKIGDNGDAFGIVQVQPKWHQNRLDKYGFTVDDLLDPVKCCIVGMDYLDELAGCPDREFEVTHILLMRYNMGPSGAATVMKKGHYSSYYSRNIMPLYEQRIAEFVAPISEPTA